jgi:probable F420-dependent oxidoreductase
VHRYEQLGFSSITFTDHQVVSQWEPVAAVAAVASVTDSIAVGTLVLDLGLRNPVLTAKAAATLELLSAGRLELGLGAGYVARNFAASGQAFVTAGERIGRLEEGLALMHGVWTEPLTTMHGRHFDVSDVPMAIDEPVTPTILIGGGGPRMMRLGGREADIVSMIPRQDTGDWSVSASLADSTLGRMAEKAAWVRARAEEAGRDPAGIELHTMVARTMVGDHAAAAVAREAAASDVAPEAMADSTLYLVGTGAEVRDQVVRWRDEVGISYVSLFDPGEEQIEALAEEVVGPLSAP